MSILILQGPHPTARQLQSDTRMALQQLAMAAGRTLETYSISSMRELVARLRGARPSDTEFVLIDPGELASSAAESPEEIRKALEELPAPYIEVHDCSDTTLEDSVCSRVHPVATIVINQDLATSYRIALGVALRRLAVGRGDIAAPMTSAKAA